MPLKLKCRCGTTLTVPTQRIGKSVRCPSCSETIVIPLPKPEQQPRSPPQPQSKQQTAQQPEAKSPHVQQPEKSDSPPEPPPEIKKVPPLRDDSPALAEEQSRSRDATEPKKEKPPTEKSQQPASREQSKPEPTKPTTAAKKSPPALKRGHTDKPKPIDSPVASGEKSKPDAAGAATTTPPPLLKPKPLPPVPKTPARPPESAEARSAVLGRHEAPAPAPPETRGAAHPLRKQSSARRGGSTQRLLSQLKMPWKKRAAGKSEAEPDRKSQPTGVVHDPAKRWSAYYLAIGVIIVALFNMGPAFYEGFQAFRLDPPRPVARWAYLAVVVGLLQIAYAFYLIQLPDWGSVWVVAILSLATTTMYAALASAVVFGPDSSLLESLQLTYVVRKKAILWCTIMLSLSALQTYFGGRVAIRWHKAFSIAYPATTQSN